MLGPALALYLIAGTGDGFACAREQHPALTRYALTATRTALAVVPPGSTWLATGTSSAPLVLWALTSTGGIAGAGEAWRRGRLTCSGTVTVSFGALRSPVDGRAPGDPLFLPVLGLARGSLDPGPPAEALLGEVVDAASNKDREKFVLPVRAGAPFLRAVGPGAALAVLLYSEALGRVDLIHGPVLRLGLSGGEVQDPSPRVAPRWYLQESTRVRRALDDREGTLAEGSVVAAALPGLGAITRPVAGPAPGAHDPGNAWGRLLFAHGLGLGLPALSISLSLANVEPGCVTFCMPERQPLSFDEAYLAELRRAPLPVLARARSRLHTFEWVGISAAALTALIPTLRRGSLLRYEVLEDLLIMGEGVAVGLSTPLWLQARIGRARPLTFVPGSGVTTEGRDGVGPPLVAIKTTEVASAAAAASALLLFEDAGLFWTGLAMLALSSLVAATAVAEVQAGLAFPSDVPLSVVQGFLGGASVVLWHRIFWRGWPGDDRGSLPLRVLGLGLGLDAAGASVTLRGGF